ncbi:Vacuolar protein-sorting-associated protein 25 [Chamberlinius hualienensis]
MGEFNWPWQYKFPPFFTIQPNVDTRNKQLEAWGSLILNYHRVKRLFILDVTEAQNSPLFFNKEIDRKLSLDAIYTVLESVRQKGGIEWTDKARKRCYIYWRTPEEWGKLIYNWVIANGLNNSVCTLYEITGEESIKEEFYGLDEKILLRALQVLESDKKAELFSTDGSEGVKFF